MDKAKSFLLLMMGGSGTRVGGDVPKQYIEIEGKPIFYYILKRYSQLTAIDNICIVSHSDWICYVKESVPQLFLSDKVLIVEGGETRSESVKNGLKAIDVIASGEDVVLIHDATHPYVDEVTLPVLISTVKKYGGATLGEFQYDTCYEMDEEHFIKKVLPRQSLVAGASPEGFLYKDISQIYFNSTKDELEQMSSAGAIALHYGITMKVIQTDVLNLKITHTHDLELLKLLLLNYFFQE